MQIGLAHQQRLTELRQTLTVLKDVSTGEFEAAFNTQLQRLDSWTARIAAIGQVKAGKSSTLNTLVGELGFLPADVNPWTSVVTNMRLNVPGDPKTGARFEFFDEESWDRIINGDPNVREAAKKFLPGFDPEILRAQTEEMRQHAARRLGPAYVKLLGKQHDYDLLSGELLESYVCAGAGSNQIKDDDTIGRYSSITKVANLFIQSDKYAGPTIITDTPGVNDPFLVRDEFTCQSLDLSDIFLVMLSAHQALTEVDVALIRMLAMQGDKDVIIYINRVDELEDSAERIKRIVKDVKARITKAIPEAQFSIIFGSAHWAEAAMDNNLADAELRKLIRFSKVDEFNATNRSETPQTLREKLLVASGLPEIERTLSNAIDNGAGSRLLDSVSMEANAQVAAMKSLSRRQRYELQDQIEIYGSGKIAEFREKLEDEMALLAETYTSLAELIEGADQEIDETVNTSWVAIQQQMDGETAKFIKTQREAINNLLQGNVQLEEGEVDLLPLRVALEDRLRNSYTQTRGNLDKVLDRALAQAIEIAGRATEGLGEQIAMDGLPGESVAVTFATSRKTLSFNLVSRRGLKFWKKSIDLDKTVDAFRRVTSAEVKPATNKMVDAYTSTMTQRAMVGKSRLNLVAQIVEQSLNDRIIRLREDHKLLKGDIDEAAKSKILNRLHNDIEIIDNRLQVIGSKESTLSGGQNEQAA